MRFQVIRRNEIHNGNDEYSVRDNVVGAFISIGDAQNFCEWSNYWLMSTKQYMDHYIKDMATGEIHVFRNTHKQAVEIASRFNLISSYLQEAANV